MTQNSSSNDLTIVDALVQLSFAVQSILLRVGTTHDVSLVQMRLFGVLRDREPEMLALARYLNLDKSSLTGLIDRAERRGLVQRMPIPDDKRVFRIVITPRGRQLAAEIAAQVEAEILKLVAHFNESDRIHLTSLISVILDIALKQPPP